MTGSYLLQFYKYFTYAVLTNEGKYTIFEFNNQRVRFIISDKLEIYTKVIEWDNGYLVVMAVSVLS